MRYVLTRPFFVGGRLLPEGSVIDAEEGQAPSSAVPEVGKKRPAGAETNEPATMAEAAETIAPASVEGAETMSEMLGKKK